jgi:DNA helicase-2/ATP-dependent DNA helicase PcrA
MDRRMDIQDTLNKEQREAVLHLKGPLLILAGAGSGKTRVLTHRIAYMIEEKGVNPWNIMAITFTNKAAGEMRERIDKMVGFGSESIWVSTFHSSCVRILRRYIERIGFDNHFTIYDMDDQKSVMKDICKRLEIDTKIYKERNLLAAISSAKDEMISPKEFTLNAEGDFGLQKVAKVYTEYQNVLKGNNALDFDDLIIKTVELFLECPDVLESYQNRFSYIMVDEYQDTNTAQFEFIRLLAKRDKNLCVVGDDDQSIYKFRGANIRNILEFESNYPDAKVIKLEQNYRSTQNILDAANEVIKNNRGRKEKALWTNEGRGAPIHFCQFDHGGEEAEYIVEDIRHKTKAGGINYKDCAILYRTNAQSRLLEEQFVLSGIPYRVVGGVNFYARKEIKDLLAYLKTIHNGQDDLAVKRIINVPKRGIGTTTINRIQEYALSKGISFYESLCEADEILSIGKSVGKLKPFVTMIQAFRSKLDYLSLEELMNDIIETTNYVKELEMSDDEDAEDRISNIEEFMSKIVAFESNAEEPPTLGEFLEEISLVADIDNVEEKDDRVLLMTLHSAKGLEFSNVYLTGMEDGIFPSYMTIVSDDPTDMEEERRLCYVGITRAKKALTLTCAKQRMIRGETQYNPISRFIREIPGELLDNLPPSRKMSRQDMEELTIFSQSGRNSAPSSVRQKQAITSRPILSGKPASAENPASIFSRNSIGTGKKAAAVVQGKKTGLTMAETLDYGEGDRVSHMKFGQGTVMQIVKGGRDYEVTVQFDQGGIKKMFATFAKLKKT